LWLSLALADNAAFKTQSAGGNRGVHAALAVPRILALVVGVPAALAALALSVEFGARTMKLDWPPGLGAAFGCALTLHGLWFVARHPQLPESVRLRFAPFATAVGDAAFDFCALLALLLLVASVFRLPVLVKELANLPADSERGEARLTILRNAALLFVDLLCMPAIVILIVCPWRWSCAKASICDDSVGQCAKRGKLLLNTIDAVVDIPFILCGFCTMINPWRCYVMVGEMSNCGQLSACRLIALRHLGLLLLDLGCFILLLLQLPTPWRFAWAVQDAICDMKGHQAVCWHLALAPLDVLAIVSMLLVAPTHRSMLCKSSAVTESWREGPGHQVEAMQAALNMFIDMLLCGMPLLCLVLFGYRLPVVIAGLKQGEGRAFICWQFAALMVEIPLFVMGLALVVVPWRFIWLINDLRAASDVAAGRWSVVTHFGNAIGDIFAILAFLGVVATGYRLPVVIAGLQGGKRRAFVCWQLGVTIVEIPLFIMALALIAIPWRFVWLIKDVCETTDITFRRLAVFHHLSYALADVLAILALMFLLLTAPHRFFALGTHHQFSHSLGISFVDPSMAASIG
jgi:hypothetical protein